MSHDANPHAHHPHPHDAENFVRAVEHASEERGLRLTPLRKEVLELVAAADKPVKAYDLLDQLRELKTEAGAVLPRVVFIVFLVCV